MTTYLDRILAEHRAAAADDPRQLDALIEQAQSCEPARGFRAGLAAVDGLGVISEIKRRSPSKGDLNTGVDPASWARSYERGGATALSVLTDANNFGGSVADLQAARTAISLPVLRKDFTVSANDVCDARIMGADAVLLIVAALDQHELADFHALATDIGLDVLVETHDEAEVERAMAVGATLVGVNQRDLVTFEVDTERAIRVGRSLPDDVIRVAESGVRGPDDCRSLKAAGYHAVLVGESLVTSGDPAAAVADLRAV
ncbi:MAG: indole-3-glycerol phosphate synthase TrpC [Acidimicrobiales bacterium]